MTALRPVRRSERALLAGWAAAVSSPFDDFSGPPPPGVWAAAAGRPAGFGRLLVTDDGDTPIGSVSWHRVHYGPGAGSVALNVGISLRPPARGQGHGTRAQHLLAEHLFATTAVHRLEASTDVTNVVEQRALTGAGFRREGIVRGAQWRGGRFHDLVCFARLRDDA